MPDSACEAVRKDEPERLHRRKGIAEAAGRPKMRFVPVKSDDQQDLQSLHRVRERWLMPRTAVINQISWLAARTWNHFAQGTLRCG
jgi:transposase